jgi:hypothetical protein
MKKKLSGLVHCDQDTLFDEKNEDEKSRDTLILKSLRIESLSP